MDFVGRGKRIEDVDLPRIGSTIGVGEDVVHAILDVESRGSGFDSLGRPVALFEPHWFYKLLPVEERVTAEHEGLAYRNWGERPYPRDSYPTILRAMAINRDAALKATSWGSSQIMGFNFSLLGYASVKEMVLAFMDDEENHVRGMIDFIRSREIDDELRDLEKANTRDEMIVSARAFARVYNGPQYAKNNYHTRIVDRLVWWRSKPDTPWSPMSAAEEELDNNPNMASIPPQPEVKEAPKTLGHRLFGAIWGILRALLRRK